MPPKEKQEIRIFIGSSGAPEAMNIAYQVQDALYKVDELFEGFRIIPRLWCGDDDIFKNGQFTFQSLIKELENDNAAIFIYNGDDDLIKKGEQMKVTRANVIFEHGLFAGHLGKEKVFLLLTGGKPEDTENDRKKQTPDIDKILSDYSGVCNTYYSSVQYNKSGLVPRFQKWIDSVIVENERNSFFDENKKNDYEITASIVKTHGDNDNRNSAFIEMYKNAQDGDSIKVLGSGVTSFLLGDYIGDLLERGVNVTVLLMHDKIIKSNEDCELENHYKGLIKSLNLPKTGSNLFSLNKSCPVSIRNVLIDKKHFEDYQQRQNCLYIDKMHHAYEFCKKLRSANPSIFNYYYFNSFIPMSMTAFQNKGEKENGKLIVEFIIPFTKNRILLQVSEKDNKAIFDRFMDFYDIMEEKAKKNDTIKTIKRKKRRN